MNKNNKIIYFDNNYIMQNAICLNIIGQISSGKTNVNKLSEKEKSFLLKFLLVSLGIDKSTTVEKMLEQEKGMQFKKIKNDLLIFENHLRSLPDMENHEPIIKIMELKLLDDEFYSIFNKKICNYFKDSSFKEGIIIFLSNIFEPSLRRNLYLFFWDLMNNDESFTRQYGKDFFKIIESITFNEKELNDFECFLNTYN